MSTFRSLSLSHWRQYDEVNIVFHPQLTILTGANGSGKTTILNILNKHFGWTINLVGTPRRKTKGVLEYLTGLWSFGTNTGQGQVNIGSIQYTDGGNSPITVPASGANQYQINISGQKAVSGIFISSHRPVAFYEAVNSIPTQVSARQQILQTYVNESRTRFMPGNRRTVSASYRIKEALISLATFGYGNQVVTPNEEAITTFKGFENVLKIILPPSLEFQRLKIEMPEVVLETNTGDFSLDAASGGISSLLDVSWQIYMASLVYGEFTAIIDEPENHLHPELQKRLLSSLIEAFPKGQFIVATHNPFIVNSVPDSNVYVLNYFESGERRAVRSQMLDTINKAGTSNEILREVLGVDVTLPIWAEKKVEEIVNRNAELELTEANLQQMREEMASLGLGEQFPTALSKVLDVRNDQANQRT